MTPFKRVLRSGFRALLRIYFRRIEVVGERPSAATRGRVFVANHSNALIDPILVLIHAPCDMSPLAKSTLWDIPGLKYLLDLADAVPVLRRRDDPNKPQSANDEMFDKIARHLERGGNVLVFPEGTSHNEPQLIRLKTGAARMLERAIGVGARDLTFQAVGLEFDARNTFRSRAVVAYGPVRHVEDFEGDLVEGATRRMHDDLEEMVVEGASWEERRLVLRIAELVRNDRGGGSFAEAVGIAQAVEHARDDLRQRNPELAKEVERSVRAYLDALEAHGITDESLTGARSPDSAHWLGEALGWLGLPLFPLGVALYFIPYQLPRLVAGRTDELDQHSTLKLGTGLVAYPVWAGLLTLGAWATMKNRSAAAAATFVILASPFAALHWMERLEGTRLALRLFRRRHVLVELGELRKAAMAAILRAQEATVTAPNEPHPFAHPPGRKPPRA